VESILLPRHRIEIIGLDGMNFYSIGTVEVDSKQNIYIFYKEPGVIIKVTRHAGGKHHQDLIDLIRNKTKRRDFPRRSPISELKGVEIVSHFALFSKNYQELFTEYKLRKTQGIFCIDLREYDNKAINLSVQIVKRDFFPDLLNTVVPTEKRQVYIYAESDPIVSMFVFSPK